MKQDRWCSISQHQHKDCFFSLLGKFKKANGEEITN